MLAGALAVVGLILPAASAHATSSYATSAHTARVAGPAQHWSFSISGTNGVDYLHAGNGTANASAETDQEWNAGGYETYAVSITEPNGRFYNVEFASRHGSNRRLAPGYYPWAQDAQGQLSKGRPGISIWGGSNPCGGSSGSFEVRDIARAKNGDITRLDVVFTRYCLSFGFGDVDIGELKIGYPRRTYEVSPDEVAWPWTTVYPGQSAPDVHPVNIRRTSRRAVTVSRPYVTGRDHADFRIRKQNCTGRLTAKGCRVWVGFTPKARGPRHAELIVPTSNGRTAVSLDGFGAVGTSTWTVHTNWPATPSHEVIPSVSAGNPHSVITQGFQPLPPPSPDAEVWTADFSDTHGLKPGTTYTYHNVVPTPPFTMSIAQGDGGCELNTGSVKVNDLASVGPDHQLSRLDAFLKATCKSSTPYWVTVRMRFHEAADLRAPGPVIGLRITRRGTRVTLRWKNPSARDLAGVIIRWYPSAHAPGAWFTGNTAYQGTGRSVSFRAPAGRPVSVTAWTYDTTGNVGTGTRAHLR
ncbi:MAG TPA: hypothetical protein VEV63_05520 [Streptosporangiaceae bacterium]|nr:hypothetical protein [Streptosporangiaceae bacterium]